MQHLYACIWSISKFHEHKSLVTVIKMKAKYKFHTAAILSYIPQKENKEKKKHFSRTWFYKFQDPIINGVRVAVILPSSCIRQLGITDYKKLKVRVLGSLQWRNTHTKFHQNESSNPWVEICGLQIWPAYMPSFRVQCEKKHNNELEAMWKEPVVA
jgi:hypothetical protein